MTPSKIERKYLGRAYKVLESIREALNEAGLNASMPWHWKDDVLRIQMAEGPEGDLIDITLEFLFSEQWDGEKGGVNFGINIVHEGGAIVGGLTPFNYSSEVWVPRRDPAAVEERFSLLEQADVSDIPRLIKEFRERRRKKS